MKRFIEIVRLFDRDVMRDILDADRIENIYIEYPGGKTIVIVLDNGKRYKEQYQSYGFCLERFRQLSGYLKAKPFTINHLEDSVDWQQEE